MSARFVADPTVGKLAKWLRIMGYDVSHLSLHKPEQIRSMIKEGRRLLTKNSRCALRCEEALLIRSDHVAEQLRQLRNEGCIKADRTLWFTRCMLCNEVLLDASPQDAGENVPDYVFLENPSGIRSCPSCRRFFWPGSHKQKMIAQLEAWGF